MKSSLTIILLSAIVAGCSNEAPLNDRKAEAPTKGIEAKRPSEYNESRTATFKKESQSSVTANVPYAWSTDFDQSLPASAKPTTQLMENRQMIWNADLEFRVKNLDKSFRSIRMMCEKYNGFIADMEQLNEDSKSSMHIHIRVKSNQFHDLVSAVKGESENLDLAVISSDDVTEEFVDLQNRLETKRNARERYIEILRSKTGTIEEVIEAEEAIRRITEEIEAKEGRLRYLNDRVDLSTVDIEMYTLKKETTPAVAETPTFGDNAKSSFASGWAAIKSIGLALISIWPLLLLATVVVTWKRRWIQSKLALKK